MERGKFILVAKIALALCVFISCLVLVAYRQRIFIERVQENVMYFLNPSTDRAFSYGLQHFDAGISQEYDVNRAQYFFLLVLAQDPHYPMVHHELARIAFLHSDFSEALILINDEFADNPKPDPSSYYVRALIEGYMSDYHAAEKDYEAYFKIRPATWAGINDYSWVLLKDDLPQGAHASLSWGLKQWPENAWLLSNDAIALYELGRYSDAATVAKKAVPAVQALTVTDWLHAYPGNDPLIAQTGLDAFKKTTQENLSKILTKAK